MSRLNDDELQAELLNRGAEELYYGEEWPGDAELQWDSMKECDDDDSE